VRSCGRWEGHPRDRQGRAGLNAGRRRHREGEAAQLAYFRERRSLEEAVLDAATARINGRKHGHQRRIPPSVLQQGADRLLDNLDALRSSSSFDDLHDTVNAIIGPVCGIDELVVYDTAVRIGAYLGLGPTQVYFHAGTRQGAKALGLDWRRATLPIDVLPKALHRLSAGASESALCIYKGDLGGNGTGNTNGCTACGSTVTAVERSRSCG
jgi:hypothetical protein